MSNKQPDTRDLGVGKRIRALRLERGMSQTALGERLGVTFQQVQKYEKGANRIGAGRLQHIAEIFGVPVTVFFAGREAAAKSSNSLFELVDTSASLRLLRALSQIPNPAVKHALVALAEQIAQESR